MEEFIYDYYMICPVRKATDDQKKFLEEFTSQMGRAGKRMVYPAVSTNQDDPSRGLNICRDHSLEMAYSRAFPIYWVGSTGSYVDLGATMLLHFTQNRDIILINYDEVEATAEKQVSEGIKKSYEQVLPQLHRASSKKEREFIGSIRQKTLEAIAL
jgi:hypothetical protein